MHDAIRLPAPGVTADSTTRCLLNYFHPSKLNSWTAATLITCAKQHADGSFVCVCRGVIADARLKVNMHLYLTKLAVKGAIYLSVHIQWSAPLNRQADSVSAFVRNDQPFVCPSISYGY